MENQFNNGFCPKCGALLRDNVCPSCGFGETNPEATETTVTTETMNGMETAGQQPRPYEAYMNNMYDPNAYNNAQQGGYDSNAYNTQQGSYDPNAYNTQQGGYDPNAYNMQGGYNAYNNGTYGQNGYYTNPAQPPQKKSNKGVIAIVISGVVLLIAAIVAVIFVFVKAFNAEVEDAEYSYEDDYDYDYDEDDSDEDYDFDDEDDYDFDEEDDYDFDDYEGDEDLLAFVDDIDWDDDEWDDEPYNYDAEDLQGDIYYELANCIDEDVDYKLVHESYEELDEDLNVCIRINYYQIEGDIPNVDEINEVLKAQAMWAGDSYHEDADLFAEEFEEYGAGYVVEVDSYITYNDDEVVSVVSEIYYESATSIEQLIACCNVDLVSGEVVWNSDLFDFSDEFIADFREVCEEQNGYIASIDNMSDDEIKEFFEDESSFIFYLTPCGAELGINYTTEEKYGWVSATFTDYDDYMVSY
ncbi:MAG: hypothetical protein J6K37_00720 [Lachnospiraceae bacterium]|nr:hypothetical protein [Lachnospiraceae bacterium]